METLIEIFPFAFGVLLGLTCEKLGGLRTHIPLWVGASIPLGAFATFVSGEWRESVLFFAADIALVAGTALATSLAWRALRQVRSRR
jgi:hypothetical protein